MTVLKKLRYRRQPLKLQPKRPLRPKPRPQPRPAQRKKPQKKHPPLQKKRLPLQKKHPPLQKKHLPLQKKHLPLQRAKARLQASNRSCMLQWNSKASSFEEVFFWANDRLLLVLSFHHEDPDSGRTFCTRIEG